jgi:hypothetical protein
MEYQSAKESLNALNNRKVEVLLGVPAEIDHNFGSTV